MGPLSGLRLVEMAGIGPAPFCGMLLADMGAEVIRIDRLVASDLGLPVDTRHDLLNRSKRAVALDLKSPAGVEAALRLIARADALIEGFRPGVMERLGLGPERCLALNPRLVYGRMTGYGQDGPMKDRAGHDINYIAVTGALAAIGPREGPPVPPLNLVGDFGGGALYLAMGVLAALFEARGSGRGQVVDAAMVDGVASLMTMMAGLSGAGLWRNERAANPIDGGAPYYATYRTQDGGWMAVGAIEERFYQAFLHGLGLSQADLPDRNDRSRWQELRGIFAVSFAARSRAEWEAVFAEGDACVTPVLDMEECRSSRLAVERGMYGNAAEGPASAPRFSRTPGVVRAAPVDARADTAAALAAWGFGEAEIAALACAGAIAPT